MLKSVENLTDQEVKGKNVLVRVSFDTFDKEGFIKDSLRIEASEKTLRVLKDKGAKKIILLTYAGRPNGYDPLLSLRPTADFLYGVLREEVYFISAVGRLGTFIKDPKDYVLFAKNKMDELPDGSVVILDNLRFWSSENKGDDAEGKEFAKLIATLGNVYVQDGFAQAHRVQNATVGEITKYVETKVIGMEFKREIDYLQGIYDNLLKENRKPFIFIIGGKKLETRPGIVSKLDVVNKLMETMRKGDKILIGGAISFPFLVAREYMDKINNKNPKDVLTLEDVRKIVGRSFIEESEIFEHIRLAKETILKGEEKGIEVKLPLDHVVSNSKVETVKKIEIDMSAGDIGAKTIKEWTNDLKEADTIIYAGPVGWYENALFTTGSQEIAKAIVESTKNGAVSIAAGGDTSAMIKRFNYHNDFSLTSIGGGATLEFLMQGSLPVMKLLDEVD